MGETLNLISPERFGNNETVNLEAFRSQLKQLEESKEPLFDSYETSSSDSKKLIEELAAEFQRKLEEIQTVEPSLRTVDPKDLDAFIEQLKKEISLSEEENMNISSEINNLTTAIEGYSNQLDGDLEKLAFSLKLIDSQGLHYFQAESGDAPKNPMSVTEDQNFEILKLHQQIEKATNYLITLQDLDNVLKRVEGIGQIEDKLSSVKVLDFEGNCIRLSLKTHMASVDGLVFGHKLDCLIEPSMVEHELLIEVADTTLELHKAEIFPNDISLDAIVHSVKSSSTIPVMMSWSTLQCLVRDVQYHILVCNLRRLLVKDANNSRHFFEYSDRDEMITAHLLGGIDAFIKTPQGWPISNSALMLVSIKNSIHSNSISLSFLCRIKELANSFHIQIRGHIVLFADAIEEILVEESMKSKLQSNGAPV